METNDEQTFLPFSRPSISDKTIAEVTACLRSGWLATGQRVQTLEQNFKNYLTVPHAQLVTSATAGLHISLIAIDIQPGDEIITTPMTWVSTLNMIALCGAKPVLVDVEPHTYNMDVNQVENLITEQTKAIIPIHFAGAAVNLDPLYDLARKYNLRIIEDAAHVIGSSYKGKKIGSFGDIQIFSFHPCKNLTTAEGGCITSRDDHFAERIKRLRFHGIDRDAWNRYSKGGSSHFDIIEPGYKYNMSDVQAAIGLDQLDHLDEMNGRRKYLAERYKDMFSGWPELSLPGQPLYDHEHTWHIFAPLINPEKAGMTRDEFMTKMKEHNIGTGLHFAAAHLYSYYRETYGYKEGNFPHAEHIGERIVSLPLFPSMSDKDQDRVVKTMKMLWSR